MRRVRRAPKKLAEVSCEEWIPATLKDFISQSFNEVIDLIKNLISSRFSQEGFKLVMTLNYKLHTTVVCLYFMLVIKTTVEMQIY